MSHTTDDAAELEQLTESLSELTGLRAHPGVHAPAPAVSGWSIAQHLYHVALATDMALDNVRRIVHDAGAQVVHEGGLNEGALRMFAEGAIPRGAAEAPRMVRPAERVDPGLLEQELDRARAAVEDARPLLAAIPGATGRVRHPLLGELSAREWLRFASIHARHHLAIVRDILGA
jgi:hypothetical protein